MAELILTKEEREAALWSDLDDADVGRMVKSRIAAIETAAGQLDRTVTLAAAMIICCAAAEANAKEIKLTIGGLTQAGREFGDWELVGRRT